MVIPIVFITHYLAVSSAVLFMDESTFTPSQQAADNGDSTLPVELAELLTAAREARRRAYAPYSKFAVGAAVRTSDNRITIGANVENASYGLTVCAERSAVLQTVINGARRIVAVAVCTDLRPPAAPCGMCRHTIAEFATDECEVVLGTPNPSDAVVRLRLGELLPMAFRPNDLLVDFAAQQHEAASDQTNS